MSGWYDCLPETEKMRGWDSGLRGVLQSSNQSMPSSNPL
jgi:hypothetical protein